MWPKNDLTLITFLPGKGNKIYLQSQPPGVVDSISTVHILRNLCSIFTFCETYVLGLISAKTDKGSVVSLLLGNNLVVVDPQHKYCSSTSWNAHTPLWLTCSTLDVIHTTMVWSFYTVGSITCNTCVGVIVAWVGKCEILMCKVKQILI